MKDQAINQSKDAAMAAAVALIKTEVEVEAIAAAAQDTVAVAAIKVAAETAVVAMEVRRSKGDIITCHRLSPFPSLEV